VRFPRPPLVSTSLLVPRRFTFTLCFVVKDRQCVSFLLLSCLFLCLSKKRRRLPVFFLPATGPFPVKPPLFIWVILHLFSCFYLLLARPLRFSPPARPKRGVKWFINIFPPSRRACVPPFVFFFIRSLHPYLFLPPRILSPPTLRKACPLTPDCSLLLYFIQEEMTLSACMFISLPNYDQTHSWLYSGNSYHPVPTLRRSLALPSFFAVKFFPVQKSSFSLPLPI